MKSKYGRPPSGFVLSAVPRALILFLRSFRSSSSPTRSAFCSELSFFRVSFFLRLLLCRLLSSGAFGMFRIDKLRGCRKRDCHFFCGWYQIGRGSHFLAADYHMLMHDELSCLFYRSCELLF